MSWCHRLTLLAASLGALLTFAVAWSSTAIAAGPPEFEGSAGGGPHPTYEGRTPSCFLGQWSADPAITSFTVKFIRDSGTPGGG